MLTCTNATLIHLRAEPDHLAAIDEGIQEDVARFGRPEAIRALVNHALGRTVAFRGIKPLPPRLRSLDGMDDPK